MRRGDFMRLVLRNGKELREFRGVLLDRIAFADAGLALVIGLADAVAFEGDVIAERGQEPFERVLRGAFAC